MYNLNIMFPNVYYKDINKNEIHKMEITDIDQPICDNIIPTNGDPHVEHLFNVSETFSNQQTTTHYNIGNKSYQIDAHPLLFNNK